jgi:hypothetical protein
MQALPRLNQTGHMAEFLKMQTKQQLVFKEGLELEDEDWTTWSSRVEGGLVYMKGQVNPTPYSNKCALNKGKFP